MTIVNRHILLGRGISTETTMAANYLPHIALGLLNVCLAINNNRREEQLNFQLNTKLIDFYWLKALQPKRL